MSSRSSTVSPDHMARLFKRDVVAGTMSSMAVDLLGRYLEKRGVDRHEVMSPDDLQAANQFAERYPVEAFCRLLLRAAQRLQDPCMGFHMGLAADSSLLGPLGYAMMACENLGAALLHLQRYARVIQNTNSLQPHFSGDNLVLEWGMARGKPGVLFDELGITGMVKLARDLCRDQVDPAAIDFANPPPRDTAPYTAFFRCQVRFDQPSTKVLIPLAALQAPLKRPDPMLLKLMSRQMDATLSQVVDDEDLAASARRVIVNLAPRGIPELEQVACVLSLAPKVLYRRLTEQGLNFRTLREEALHGLAETYLRQQELTLAEVGTRLGYAEQSAFTRAFKRWTGMTPIQWRSRFGTTLPNSSSRH